MGILDWLGGLRKTSDSPSNVVPLKKEIDYEEVLSKFQEVALESLNAIRYAIMDKDKKKAVKLSENFYLQYSRFTDHQKGFQKKGGKVYMAYRLIVGSIGPVYMKVNEYVNGTSINNTLLVKEMEKAIRTIAEMQPARISAEQEADKAAVAK